MMLDGMSQQEHMHSTFRVIEQVGSEPSVSQSALLEARMVYHAICGSLPKAVEATIRVLEIDRERGNYGDLSRRLMNAATVLRGAGLLDDAYACLREAEELVATHKLPSAGSSIHVKLACHELEDGDIKAAQEHYEKLVTLNPRYRTPFLDRDVALLGARLALLRGDATEALRLFGRSLHESMNDQRGQSLVYELAVFVAIQLSANQLSHKVVQDLEDAHIASRRSFSQGFASVVLYAALHALGKGHRGDLLMSEYTIKYRRERFPISRALFAQGGKEAPACQPGDSENPR
jgi:tetratricopeptide (TPR) repeat protein